MNEQVLEEIATAFYTGFYCGAECREAQTVDVPSRTQIHKRKKEFCMIFVFQNGISHGNFHSKGKLMKDY